MSIGIVQPAGAVGGELDPSFGGDGKVTTNFTDKWDAAIDVALQADGKIVAAGEWGFGKANPRFALARYNEDGTLDVSFSDDGKVATNFTPKEDYADAVAVQGDGKIVAGGWSGLGGSNPTFALARYNEDGTLDIGFGDDGKVTTNFTPDGDGINDLAIQADQKIVVVGTAGFGGSDQKIALARYHPDGTLDTTFHEHGKLTTTFGAKGEAGADVVVQEDGKIVAAGGSGIGGPNWNFAVARYNPDGTLDPTFSDNGKVTTSFTPKHDFAYDLAVQTDGKIVAAGFSGGSNPKFALARYNEDGTLDTAFSGDGLQRTNFTPKADVGFAVGLQSDGRIVAAGGSGLDGSNPTFALARYNEDGTLDATFGGDGKVTTNFTPDGDVALGLAIQPDDKAVAAGVSGDGGPNPKFALARYLPA